MFKKIKSLGNNHDFVNGVVSKLFTARGMAIGIVYYYQVDSTIYENQTSINLKRSEYEFWEKFLIGKNFRVVYEKTNHTNSDLLMTSSDYKRYNANVPPEFSKIVNYIDSAVGVNR